MAQIKVHDLDVFYRDQGRGPAVVLGHSSTGSSGQWRALIEDGARKYRMLAPDHIGYGRTPFRPGSVPLMVHEVAIVHAIMQLSDHPVHLVGHSYGGSILARAAALEPGRVRSLTLIEPSLFFLLSQFGRDREHDEIKAVAERVKKFVGEGDPRGAARGFISYWVGDGTFDGMDARVQDGIVRGMTKLASEWSEAFVPNGAEPDRLAAIEAPVQLVCATRTTPAAKAVIDILRGIWPGAEHVDVENAGHMSPVTHAAQVNACIKAFVDRAARVA